MIQKVKVTELTRINKDSWMLNRPIAHRGLHDMNIGIPENSLAAFARAVDNGYPIELDVQKTLDSQLFVLHDYNTDRVCGIDFDTKVMQSEMLKDFKLCGTDQSIPLFSDVLELVNGKVPILIEIKSEKPYAGELEFLLHEMLKEYHGEIAIESFNPLSIRYMRKRNPDYIVGQLSYQFEGKDNIPAPVRSLLKSCKLNFLSKPDFIAYDIKAMPQKFLKALKDGGDTALLGWTVRTEENVEFANLECDNYIFENVRP